MRRRGFLKVLGATIGGALLTQRINYQQDIRTLMAAEAETVSSTNGLLDIALAAELGQTSLAGRSATLMAYNGRIPGPFLEARPGDRVRIQFTNRLPNSTNLHFHGLHIPPTGNGDNVFRQIQAGASATYEFEIPSNHHSTLGWYHPHWHGLTADQLFGGLAGLFVVRGDLDEIPEIAAAQEEFLVLKDFEIDASGQVVSTGRMLGREGSLLTVNGQLNPTINLATGGLLRLRIANASTSRFYRLALENHTFHLIATDGGGISSPVEQSELLLTPGERVDVLVRGEQDGGQFRLLNLPYDRGGMMMGGGMMGRGMMGRGMMGRGMMGRGMMGDRQEPVTEAVLATVMYSGQVEPLPLPERLVEVEPLPEPSTVRRLTLNHGMAMGRGMMFLIDGKPFEANRIDTQVRLGTVEDWELTNTGVMDHPFHIHVNPFQIVERNGQPEAYRAWKDTVLVPVGETVRIRMRFNDYTGKTVYHCHILDHEDLGMMGTLDIVA